MTVDDIQINFKLIYNCASSVLTNIADALEDIKDPCYDLKEFPNDIAQLKSQALAVIKLFDLSHCMAELYVINIPQEFYEKTIHDREQFDYMTYMLLRRLIFLYHEESRFTRRIKRWFNKRRKRKDGMK